MFLYSQEPQCKHYQLIQIVVVNNLWAASIKMWRRLHSKSWCEILQSPTGRKALLHCIIIVCVQCVYYSIYTRLGGQAAEISDGITSTYLDFYMTGVVNEFFYKQAIISKAWRCLLWWKPKSFPRSCETKMLKKMHNNSLYIFKWIWTTTVKYGSRSGDFYQCTAICSSAPEDICHTTHCNTDVQAIVNKGPQGLPLASAYEKPRGSWNPSKMVANPMRVSGPLLSGTMGFQWSDTHRWDLSTILWIGVKGYSWSNPFRGFNYESG